MPGFDQACVFYPYLDERTRAPYTRGYPTADGLLAIGPPFDDRPMYGYGNCWWGITRSALVAMLRAARFEVIEGPWTSTRPFYTAAGRPAAADGPVAAAAGLLPPARRRARGR